MTASFAEGVQERLNLAKAKAQANNQAEPFVIGSETFHVSPKGLGLYAWLLFDHRMQIRVSRAKKGLPVVTVKLLAEALATYGHRALYSQACAAIRGLGDIYPCRLSRLDLCTDVQGLDFTDTDAGNLVCAASYRAVHKDGEGVTYQIGKGDVVVRVYRKDAELKAKNKMSYAKVWERGGQYDSDQPVWRVEVQLRKGVIPELSARCVEAAFDKLPALFAFGLSWCELRIPQADPTKTRWPVDIRWKLLSSLWGECEPEPRIRRASKMEDRDRVTARLAGAVATLAAYSGERDLTQAFVQALLGVEIHLEERGLTFQDLADEKAARLAATEGVPF